MDGHGDCDWDKREQRRPPSEKNVAWVVVVVVDWGGGGTRPQWVGKSGATVVVVGWHRVGANPQKAAPKVLPLQKCPDFRR